MSAFTPDYKTAIVRPSPNHTERRGTDRPDMIVLHYTGMPTEPVRWTGSARPKAKSPATMS